jgi:integrase/recombinase XerD
MTLDNPSQSHALVTAPTRNLAQVLPCHVQKCPNPITLPRDGVLVAWLDEKTGHTQSLKTHVSYHSTALSLRAALEIHGYDLLIDLTDDTTYSRYLLIVQHWAGARSPQSRHTGAICASTYNQRLAIISSLFTYAKRMRLYRGDNPIDAVARRSVGEQQGAQALEMVEMHKRLKQIDRSSLAGRRDYALLSVGLATAQRVQALSDMRISHLSWSGRRLTIHFPRTKGGETDDRQLEVETSQVLSNYLTNLYGEDWQELKTAPVWVSYSRNGSRGQPLSVQALEQICKKYTGRSQFHTLRHTASLALDDLGVSTSDVQEFLRHKNLSTTNAYLKRQKRGRNKYGRDLEHVFGISAEEDEAEE